MCEKEIVLMFDKERVNLTKLFDRTKKIEKLDIACRFTLFLNSNFIIKKKKIKSEIVKPFSFENFIRLIEGMDESVYYENSTENKDLIGLEWRLENEIKETNKILKILTS